MVAETKQIDPTGTTRLRAALRATANRRLAQLKSNVASLLNAEDIFGTRGPNVYTTIAGLSEARKLQLFYNSFEVMNATALAGPWAASFIDRAYWQGLAYGLAGAPLMQPWKGERLGTLHLAAESELEGIAAAGMQNVNRIVAQGLQQGAKSATLARMVRDCIDKIEGNRCQAFANSVIVGAHAHGTLDGFEARGLTRVGIIAEHKPFAAMVMTDALEAVWVTAGDSQVCPQCQSHEGQVLPIEQARGMIPLHPNCRCAWEAIEEQELGDDLHPVT